MGITPTSGTIGSVTYYLGQDDGLGNTPQPRRLNSPYTNSDGARANFLAAITALGTDDFESFAHLQIPPIVLTLGAVTATITGEGDVQSRLFFPFPTGNNGSGRYPISGDKYFDSRDDFTITFSPSATSLGFYAIDLGDFDGQLTVQFTFSDTTVESFTVPHQFGVGVASGGVLYLGLAASKSFTQVLFGNTSDGFDVFGFDDFTVGLEITANPEPTPLTCGPSLGMEACPQSCPIPLPTWAPQSYALVTVAEPTGLTLCGHSLARSTD